MRRSHLVDNSLYGSQSQPFPPNSNAVQQQNDALEDDLKGKVKALKSLTIDIGHEVREQNKMLGSMEDEFEGSGNLLKATMARVTLLAKAGYHRFTWYLLAFALFVFFVCWVIIKTR